MNQGPGSRLIGSIALLVPWPQRDEWMAEWRAELAYGYERRVMRGNPAWLAALAMRIRCIAAVSDALWLRRRNSTSLLYSDVMAALRGMRRRPGFAASVVLTLSLGIGGTTAIFSVIDPLMIRPLPYPDVDRLAEIHTVHASGPHPGVYPDVWRKLRETLVPGVFERLEAGAPRSVTVTGAGEPTELRVHAFTPGALALLGSRPIVGRLFSDSDAVPGAPEVALIGEALWRRAFAADPRVIGRTLTLDDRQFIVIGVLPESFKYPEGTVSIWFPLRIDDPIWPVRGFEAIGRLRVGMTKEAAQVHTDALASRQIEGHPEPRLWKLSVQPVDNSVPKSAASALRLLAGAVACVLLIACVNAANLLLVRSTGRQTELAVRRSLGATSTRLFRQLVTETMLLALFGGLLGMLLAYVGVRAIVSLMPDLLVRSTQATVGLDSRALGFSLLVSLMTGLVFGAVPALRGAGKTRLVGANDRTMTAAATVRRAGSMLVMVELALSMMLLVGAGLLSRSFLGLLTVDPGFEPRGLAVLEITLARHRYPDDERAEAFYTSLKESLRAIPGVQGVTVSDGVPPKPTGSQFDVTFETETGEKRPTGGLVVPYAVVDADYFDVLGIPILQGRGFGAADTRTAPPSVIIDPDLAALLWPGRSAIGRRFRLDPAEPWLTVVGISGDVKLRGPDDRAAPFALFYASSQQTPWRYRSVAVRTRGDVGTLTADLRNAVRDLDPEQPVLDVASAESYFAGSLERQRFLLILMGVFTVIAVLLAAIGVYGVIAYTVAQRTREIGLRVALGATPLSMVASVLGSGLALAAMGGLIGLGAALVLSRFLTSMLYGVQPTDAATLAFVAAILGAVAGAAALVPAVRAGRISPLQALR